MGELYSFYFFFQAEDGIRDLVRSRGLGDVYKRQALARLALQAPNSQRKDLIAETLAVVRAVKERSRQQYICLLYTSDAADDLLCVDLGGRRIIKKKKNTTQKQASTIKDKKTANHKKSTITE